MEPKFEIKLVSFYLVFSILWILFSDQLLYFILGNTELLIVFQTFKGFLYVIISSGLLYSYLSSYLKKEKKTVNKLIQKIEFLNSELRRQNEEEQKKVEIIENLENKIDEKTHFFKKKLSEEINSRAKIAEKLWRKTTELQSINKTLIENNEQITATNQKLLESEVRFRELYEHMNQGVVYYNYENDTLSLNTAAEIMLDTNEETFQKKDISQNYSIYVNNSNEPINFYNYLINRAIELKRTIRNIEISRYIASKSKIWMNATVVPLFKGSHEKPYRIYVILEDITERKNTEIELQNTQAWLTNAFEQSPVPFILTDNVGSLKYINGIAKEVLGITNEEIERYQNLLLVDRKWKIFYNNQNLPFENAPLISALKGKATENLKVRIERNDGTSSWCIINTRPIYNPEKKMIGISMVFPDITEYLRAEQAMQESEQKFIQFAEYSKDVFIIRNSEGKVLFVNSSFLKITGYEQSELLNAPENIYKWVHPDDLEMLKIFLDENPENLAKERQLNFRFVCANKKIKWIWARENPVKDADNNVLRLVTIATDITVQKNAATELENYRTQLEKIVEQRTTQIKVVNKELESANNQLHSINKKLEKEIEQRIFIEKQLVENNEQLEEIVNNRTIELKQSEERYRTLSNIAEEAVFIHDNLMIVDTNLAFTKIFGYTQQEAIGMTVSKLVAEREVEKVLHYKKTNYSYPYETIGCKKNGEEFFIQTQGKSFNYKGKDMRVVVCIDITNRKITEIALKMSEERFRRIIDNTGQIIYRQSIPSFKVEFVSKTVEDIIGYSQEEFYNDENIFSKILSKDWLKLLMKFYQNLLINSNNNTIEYQILHKNGNTMWFSQRSLLVTENEKVVAIEGIITDITKRKRTDEALKLSEEKFRNIFENSKDGIIIVDSNNLVIEANKRFFEMVQQEKNEIIHKNFALFFQKQEAVAIAPPELAEILKTNIAPMELMLLDNKENKNYVELSNSKINYQNNAATLSIVRNINDRKLTQKQILDAIVDTEEKERKRFAEDLHDGLGPLLSSIKMYVHFLSEKKEEDKKQKIIHNLFEVIDEAVISLKEISNLLSPHILEDFGLVSALNHFCDKVSASKSVNIVLNATNLKHLLRQKVEVVLYRVITELINNTIKHAKASEITITLHTDATNVFLMYQDNGIGFDTKAVHESKNRGLGLFNIQNRINSFSGKYTLESAPGKGITAEVVLPRM